MSRPRVCVYQRDEQGYERLVEALPAVRARLDNVTAELGRQPVLECGHTKTADLVFVCAQHPAGGVRCPKCLRAHIERHSAELEQTCDGCGNVVEEDWTVFAVDLVAVGLRVRVPRGPRGIVVGTLKVAGLAACQACWPMPADVRSALQQRRHGWETIDLAPFMNVATPNPTVLRRWHRG